MLVEVGAHLVEDVHCDAPGLGGSDCFVESDALNDCDYEFCYGCVAEAGPAAPAESVGGDLESCLGLAYQVGARREHIGRARLERGSDRSAHDFQYLEAGCPQIDRALAVAGHAVQGVLHVLESALVRVD